MKLFLRFLILLIFLSSCSKAENQDFRLILKVSDCVGCPVKLTSYDPLYFDPIKLDSFYLDYSGVKERQLQVNELTQAYVSIGDSMQLPILIKKGETLEVKSRNETLEFSGSLSELNSLFNSIIQLISDYETIDGEYILDLELEEFFNRLDDLTKKTTFVLDTSPFLSKTERVVLQKVVKVKSLKYKYNYALMNYNFYLNEEVPKQISEIEDFPDFPGLLPFDYGFLAKAYLDMRVYPKVWPTTDDRDSINAFRLRADSLLRKSDYNSEVKNFLRAVNIKEEVYSNKNREVLKSLFLEYQKSSENSKYLSQLSKVISQKSNLIEGTEAPNIIGLDINGERIELSDLLGSTVVVDVWASWCKPCIKSFPQMDELERRFPSSRVKFLYVSVDQHEKQWKKANDKFLADKLSIIANDESTFYEDYLIAGIPRYIVIDSNGLIIDADAPSPLSEKLEEVIQSGLLD
ncbi:TlpA family protein disulfide reductase [Ekhidna sp.]|uniref:TlpA family protein disulfide reductase n=1 Tax=Ekhidna sp. TaxID=2608089 RepID=UPI003C7C754F